jgi:hypothetical protein
MRFEPADRDQFMRLTQTADTIAYERPLLVKRAFTAAATLARTA